MCINKLCNGTYSVALSVTAYSLHDAKYVHEIFLLCWLKHYENGPGGYGSVGWA